MLLPTVLKLLHCLGVTCHMKGRIRESLLLSLLGGQRSMIEKRICMIYMYIYNIYKKRSAKGGYSYLEEGSNLSAHLCEYMTRCAPCI